MFEDAFEGFLNEGVMVVSGFGAYRSDGADECVAEIAVE